MKKQTMLTTAVVMTLFACTCAMAHDGEFNPPNFDGPKPPVMGGPHKEFNNEAAKKHMEEFEKKLQLTDAQKEQIKKNQEKSRAKMKKIMEQEKKLREEKQKIMEQNRKDFESVLTDTQKETLKKMHEERIQKMKEWKEKNKDKIKNGKKGEVIYKPTPVKPKTETK